jgi:hypothetical protein
MSRYIDKEQIYTAIDIVRNYCIDNGRCFEVMILEMVMHEISKIPTADVVEVRHGEWIDKPTGAYSRMQSWCSACGKHSGIGGIESNRHKPYCPNCGAKMDGERREE